MGVRPHKGLYNRRLTQRKTILEMENLGMKAGVTDANITNRKSMEEVSGQPRSGCEGDRQWRRQKTES